MKILIAEDDPNSCKLLQAKLAKWGYEVVAAQNGNEAWDALQAEKPPQLAVLDWNMPGLSGVEICRKVRQGSNEPYTYIILLTGMHQEEDLVTGMEAGADDYITKPFKSSELRVRMRAGQRIIDLQNELIAARETMRAQATHDALTGVWNRGEIMNILGRELSRAKRQGSPVSVIMTDLDHFKKVNDTHGHQAGDAVLRTASKRMGAMLRPYDSLGRYGGEEFLVVLPGCTKENAAALAERLRAHLCDSPVEIPGGSLPVTGSFGVAVSTTETPQDAEPLVKIADEALYKAKEGGRNRVVMAGETAARTGQ